MSTTYPVAADAVRTTVSSYSLGSGSLTVASAAGFPTPTSSAPILFTVITAATYGTYPETFCTYQATGLSGATFSGLTVIDGTDTAWANTAIVEMRTCALHLNGPATAAQTSIATVNTETQLPGSRKLTAGTNITFSDGGAGSTFTINASGGGGTPGGTSGQIQYDNAGSFGGFTMSGDATLVTSTGVITISASAVTLAKMANFAASSLMGNPTGSGAAPSAITLGANLSFSGTTLVASTGGAANPGGTANQIQFNAAGVAFAGFTMSGDATVVVATGVITVSASAITLAKMANFAASSLMGNPTGSSAAPSAITLGSGLSFSGSTLVASGGGSGTVNSGTAGQFAYYATSGTAVSTTPDLSYGASGQLNQAAISAPGSPVTGDMWLDSTQQARGSYHNGITGYYNRGLYSQTARTSYANMAWGTLITTTGAIGSVSLPANFFVPGKKLRVTFGGYITTTTNVGNSSISILLGGNIVGVNITTSNTANLTNSPFWGQADIICATNGSSGTVNTIGYCRFGASTYTILNGTTAGTPSAPPNAVTVNTTNSLTFDIQIVLSGATVNQTLVAYEVCLEELF